MTINLLSANSTKWSNTLKQFVGKLPTNCLSVSDHFVGLALKGFGTEATHVCVSQKINSSFLENFPIVVDTAFIISHSHRIVVDIDLSIYESIFLEIIKRWVIFLSEEFSEWQFVFDVIFLSTNKLIRVAQEHFIKHPSLPCYCQCTISK